MKILIIINDHITYRTYIDTKAFSLINKNLVTYAINTTSNENNLKKIKIKNNCIKFDVNKKNDTLIFKISSLHFFSSLFFRSLRARRRGARGRGASCLYPRASPRARRRGAGGRGAFGPPPPRARASPQITIPPPLPLLLLLLVGCYQLIHHW